MNRTALIITLAGLMSCAMSLGQETPLWLRKNCISPDGTKVAFAYKGDIYVVGTEGGRATQLTTNEAYDSDPLWTADSRSIVFSSYREGTKDIFMTSCEGGVPQRLTKLPGNETPKAVLPDGRVLFSANIQADASYDGFPGDPQLYIVTPGSFKIGLVTSMTLSELSIAKDGKILYEDYKGYEDPLRKHHTSSVTRDVWLYEGCDLVGKVRIDGSGTFIKLSPFKGEDRNPVFASDGKTFYYLSEQDGKALNIYRSSIDSPSKSVQLTSYTQNPVRYLSVAENGTLAFSYNGELYTMRDGQEPKKLSISIMRDEVEKQMNKLTYSVGASSMAVSPSGKEVAMVIRGDVFVTSVEFKTTRRITNTPEQERNVSFSKDGRELYYSAERNGCWSIYRSALTEKEDKFFTYAVKIKEELFSPEGETSFQPQVSPDGKYVAYLRDRSEVVIKPTKGGEVKSLLKGANYSYQDGDQSFAWSPDSRYILTEYQAEGGWNNVDVALIDIESGAITDLTQSGYSDGSFRWALGGKAMTWESDKNGYRSHGSWGAESDIYIMFFDPKRMSEFKQDKEDEAIAKFLAGEDEKKAEKTAKKDSTKAEKKAPKLELTLDGRENRIIRLTRSSNNYGDHFLDNDGKKLYYITPLESGNGLCSLDLKDGSVKVIKRGVRGAITPSADGKDIYLSSPGGITKLTLASGASKSITFSGDYEYKPKAEREYMFSHVWKQVKEKFYDPELHGIDWDYYKQNYSQFLPYINNNFDFADLLSEMLGELNGSHTGARFRYSGGETLGHFGILIDWDYEGDGIRIKELLPDGVLAIADPEIKAGDLITDIEGTPIKAGDNWFELLAGKTRKKIAVCVKKAGKKAQELFITPSATDQVLLYNRWVKQREDLVTRLSGGRVGYVHVKGMDSPSFREVYSKALGKFRHCEALIVDTRHNGGGWLHDDLATFLNGEAYIKFMPRGQYIGTEPYSKWSKPSCVLVCEDNYSDASGFPYTYKTLGIGKLVGTPVPGTMTAVWWENLINPSIVFGIPQVGSWGLKEGRYLENYQIEPDVLVHNDPASELRGEDRQLEAAVKEMLSQIDK